MRKTALILAVAALTAFAACRVHLGGPHARARLVVVPHGHICIATCSHYFHGGHWYVAHRHGPGCGHHLHAGKWIVMAAAAPTPVVAVSAGHACTPMCNHYWHNGVWHRGHKHGANCGHILKGTKWILVGAKGPKVIPPGQAKKIVAPAGHICTAACTHVFHGGRWIAGHRHGPNCGHERKGGKWIMKVKVTPGGPAVKPPSARPPKAKPPVAKPPTPKPPKVNPPKARPSPPPPPQARPPKENKGKGHDKDKEKGKKK